MGLDVDRGSVTGPEQNVMMPCTGWWSVSWRTGPTGPTRHGRSRGGAVWKPGGLPVGGAHKMIPKQHENAFWARRHNPRPPPSPLERERDRQFLVSVIVAENASAISDQKRKRTKMREKKKERDERRGKESCEEKERERVLKRERYET